MPQVVYAKALRTGKGTASVVREGKDLAIEVLPSRVVVNPGLSVDPALLSVAKSFCDIYAAEH